MLDNDVYRLALPPPIAGNHGAFAHFTRLGDSPATQWVEPKIGQDNPRGRWRGEIQEGSMRIL
ncbi:MAG: hypothetical protein U5N53_27520 [Mycobacterium sp.]|nr:hypothetical protein [Mycobacterium sp.]